MEKENFKNKASRSIDEIFEKIDELEAKKDKALDAAKVEFEKMISDLHLKKDELLASYAKLFNESEENWEEVKYEFASAEVSFEEGIERIDEMFE